MKDKHGEWLVKGNIKALKKPSIEWNESKDMLDIDNNSIQSENSKIIESIKETDSELLRFLEDIIEVLRPTFIEKGLVIPDKIENILTNRKEKRKLLNTKDKER